MKASSPGGWKATLGLPSPQKGICCNPTLAGAGHSSRVAKRESLEPKAPSSSSVHLGACFSHQAASLLSARASGQLRRALGSELAIQGRSWQPGTQSRARCSFAEGPAGFLLIGCPSPEGFGMERPAQLLNQLVTPFLGKAGQKYQLLPWDMLAMERPGLLWASPSPRISSILGYISWESTRRRDLVPAVALKVSPCS